MIEAFGLEEVPEAFFVSARMKCGLYRFFPVGVGTFGSPDKPGGLSIQLCKSEKKEFYIRYSS